MPRGEEHRRRPADDARCVRQGYEGVMGAGIDFTGSARPTLGVEWEFALVDRDTRDLVNAAAPLFAEVEERTGVRGGSPRLHKELLRNTVEVVSGVCDTVADAVADLRQVLDPVSQAADDLGVDLYSA